MATNPAAIHAGLADRLMAGDVQALSRAITLVENGRPEAKPLLQQLKRADARVPVVGFTGAPGVGKSTLISAYIGHLRNVGQRVAVVSIDPSSPLSGGAILGDRLRMHRHIGDSGVFIRSSAARGHLGGLNRNIANIVRVIEAAGWDRIILETVGTGQSEIEVTQIADVCVVVLSPGMGDDVQAMKSGVLEIADVLVVNKADLPDASRTARDLRAMLRLRETQRQSIPVIEVVATEGQWVAEMGNAIEKIGYSGSE
jgi:LAO/AO transport system kinase